MNKQKENSGITLISLIITIIVMLILVAVTITAVINSGLIGKTKSAGEDYKTATKEEANFDIDLSKYVNGTGNSDLPKVTAGQRASQNSEYSDGTDTAVIPAGFTVSGVGTENTIDGGLVIYLINDMSEEEIEAINWEDATTLDKLQTTYDQFVWIPVDDINDMYLCKSETGLKSCNIKVQEAEGEEVAYCTTHNSTAMQENYYIANEVLGIGLASVSSYQGEPNILACNMLYLDYNSSNWGTINDILETSIASSRNLGDFFQLEYNDIVKSVCLNEGFYVGRYETSGLAYSRTDFKAKVVKGTIPSTNIDWYYMYAQQVKYAEDNKLNVGSTMMQGAAYEKVMKFVHEEGKYNVMDTADNNVLHNFEDVQLTGSQSADKSKNIFDLEGNARVWTTAQVSYCTRCCRGGTFKSSNPALYISAVGNGNDMPPSNDIGSMILLYIK